MLSFRVRVGVRVMDKVRVWLELGLGLGLGLTKNYSRSFVKTIVVQFLKFVVLCDRTS